MLMNSASPSLSYIASMIPSNSKTPEVAWVEMEGKEGQSLEVPAKFSGGGMGSGGARVTA